MRNDGMAEKGVESELADGMRVSGYISLYPRGRNFQWRPGEIQGRTEKVLRNGKGQEDEKNPLYGRPGNIQGPVRQWCKCCQVRLP